MQRIASHVNTSRKEEFALSSSVIYFEVNNIKDTYERLLGKEVTFIDEPHVVAKMGQTETWMVFFRILKTILMHC